MQQKIKSYIESGVFYAQQLRDVRVLGQVLFALVVLMISWSGVKTIQTNYELQKQISELKQQNAVHQLEDDNLKLQNDYYKTDQFLELSARQSFGLGRPGETQLIVPEAVAFAHTINLSGDVKKDETDVNIHKPVYQKNFEAWVDFFLHRQGDGVSTR